MASETQMTNDLCKRWRGIGAEIYPLIGGTWAPLGWPDRLIGYKGRWILVEFKKGDNWLQKDQKTVCERFFDKGLPVFVGVFEAENLGIYSISGSLLFQSEAVKCRELLNFLFSPTF